MQFVVAPEKCLTKILQSLLTFFDVSQPFKCLSILSPNITMDFLLSKLKSRLLVDELSLLLSAFSLVDVLSEILCNRIDCFGLMYVIFLFSFCTLSVLLFLVLLEDFVDLQSAINSLWIDIVFALVSEAFLCGVESFFFES